MGSCGENSKKFFRKFSIENIKENLLKLPKNLLKIKKKNWGNIGDNLRNTSSKFEKTAINMRKAGRKCEECEKKIKWK